MKYLVYIGYENGDTNIYHYGVGSSYVSYYNNFIYDGDDVSLWPVYEDGGEHKYPVYMRLSVGNKSRGSSFSNIALGYTKTSSREIGCIIQPSEYDSQHYISLDGHSYGAKSKCPSYIYGEDAGIEEMSDDAKNHSSTQVDEEFVPVPAVALSGKYRVIGGKWSHIFYDVNVNNTYTTLAGNTGASLAYNSMFIPLTFAYNDTMYRAVAVYTDENETRLALYKEYPELNYDSDNYIIMPSFVSDATGNIDDNCDEELIITAGGEIDGVFDFGDGAEMPETLARFIEANCETIGDGEYNFYTADGEIIKSYSEAPDITYMKLESAGSDNYMTIEFAGGTQDTFSWTSNIPDGYYFAGLSLAAGSTTVIIEPGQEITTTFSGAVNFYEVFIKSGYRPSVEFSIAFMKNTAENNRVDKGGYIETVFTQLGALRESTDIFSPEILFEYGDHSETPAFNYVYIEKFKRYYYLQSLTSVRTGLWRMKLKCDVLMSFKDEILSQYAYIARSEKNYNEMLNDPLYPLYSNKEIEKLASIDGNVGLKWIAVKQTPADPSGTNYAMYVVTVLQTS